MHTSVCFPTQLVDSLRPQRSAGKIKNKSKGQVANKQGGKFNKGNKNNAKGNQAEAEDELSGGHGSPETSPPPSSVKKKPFKNIKQQERELQRQRKLNKGNGGFSSFVPLDEDAEEQRRQSALQSQKAKEDALFEASKNGGCSDDAASRGSVADAAALDEDNEAPFMMDLFEESEEQLAVRACACVPRRCVYF